MFLFLLIYIVASTRNIFCLIKSFWLGFAGRPSWPSVLDKFKCNLHPRDPNLTALIPLMLRNKFVKVLHRTRKFMPSEMGAAVYCAVFCYGESWLPWGPTAALTGSPLAHPVQPGSTVQWWTLWSYCHLSVRKLCFPLALLPGGGKRVSGPK